MPNVIVKRYDGYNRALGCYINSKAHYEKVMKEKGCVSYDEGMKLVDKAQTRGYKPYDKPSEKTMEIIRTAKQVADKKGNLKCSDRMIDGMKEVGVHFDRELPKSLEGGFSDEKVS